MPPADVHVADPLSRELVGLFERSTARIGTIVNLGLRRGLDPSRVGTDRQQRGDATLAYRTRQRDQALAILGELRRHTERLGPVAVINGWRAGALTVERIAGPNRLLGTFGAPNTRAAEVAAANMTRALQAAVDRAGTNIETVFERADRLERGLPPAGIANVPFIGRRTNDPWRQPALDVVGQGLIGAERRPEVARHLAQRLVSDGVTDALTGYVNSRGARLPLGSYATMVARTTTREAVSRGTASRMTEGGLDLVTISSHSHASDECDGYDGVTFSLTGHTPGYDVLDELPPFHPNCVHVATPALDNIDHFTEELSTVAGTLARSSSPIRVETTPPSPSTPRTPPPSASRPQARAPEGLERPPAPAPFSDGALPSSSPASRDRLEAQHITDLIARDPGPEPGAREAFGKHVERQARDANRALNKTLGEDLSRFIDRQWGKKLRLRQRLLSGDIERAEVEDLAVDEYHRLEHGRALRQSRKETELDTRPIPCFVCGHFKRRPADVCDYCGDDPVTYGGDARDFNRGYGYAY